MFAAEPTHEDARQGMVIDPQSEILLSALRRMAHGPAGIEYPCDEQDFGALVAVGLAYQSGDQWGLSPSGREALGMKPARRVPRVAIRRGRFNLGITRRPALRA